MFDIKIFENLTLEEKYQSMLSALRGLVDNSDS